MIENSIESLFSVVVVVMPHILVANSGSIEWKYTHLTRTQTRDGDYRHLCAFVAPSHCSFFVFDTGQKSKQQQKPTGYIIPLNKFG